MYTTIFYNGKRLQGRVNIRQKYLYEAHLIYPYTYCPVGNSITRMGKLAISFKRDYSDKRIKEMLIRSYRIAKIIEESKKRFKGIYSKYLEELDAVKDVPNMEIRERISGKLKNWFIDYLLTPADTGLFCSNGEREYTINRLFDIEVLDKKQIKTNR